VRAGAFDLDANATDRLVRHALAAVDAAAAPR
jgi:hypothetical protein